MKFNCAIFFAFTTIVLAVLLCGSVALNLRPQETHTEVIWLHQWIPTADEIERIDPLPVYMMLQKGYPK